MLDPIGNVARKIELTPWEKWFAWYPIRVNGTVVWLKTVYRRSLTTYVDMDDWKHYQYGTIFDVLKDE